MRAFLTQIMIVFFLSVLLNLSDLIVSHLLLDWHVKSWARRRREWLSDRTRLRRASGILEQDVRIFTKFKLLIKFSNCSPAELRPVRERYPRLYAFALCHLTLTTFTFSFSLSLMATNDDRRTRFLSDARVISLFFRKVLSVRNGGSLFYLRELASGREWDGLCRGEMSRIKYTSSWKQNLKAKN